MPCGCGEAKYTSPMTDLQTAAIVTAAAAATVGLATGGWFYASRWPTSQLFGTTLVDAPDPDASRHTVALTFDDGPSPRNTPALLDALAAADTRATFFLIGNHVRRHPDLARRIVAQGHTVANHTDLHPDLARKPLARIRAEMERCQQTIAETTGVLPTLFRPPYGSRRPAVLRLARDLGIVPVLWNITARDWTGLNAEDLLARIDKGMARNRRRGRTSNLLLHDASHLDGKEPRARATTVSVVQTLLQRPSLRFVPVTAFLQP